jgi:hypothetical protein
MRFYVLQFIKIGPASGIEDYDLAIQNRVPFKDSKGRSDLWKPRIQTPAISGEDRYGLVLFNYNRAVTKPS